MEEQQEAKNMLGSSQLPIDVLLYFDIYRPENLSINEERQLTYIVQELQKTGKKTPDIILTLHTLENRIQKPKIDASRIMNLYNYFRISKQAEELEKMRASYE